MLSSGAFVADHEVLFSKRENHTSDSFYDRLKAMGIQLVFDEPGLYFSSISSTNYTNPPLFEPGLSYHQGFLIGERQFELVE